MILIQKITWFFFHSYVFNFFVTWSNTVIIDFNPK